MSFFQNASGIVIHGGTFLHKDKDSTDLTLLYEKVAPNAILNGGGRADPVRCHPGTREEVIEKMEKRITSNNTGDRGVFWLSGPAGAGKSAIMQTVAEQCAERQIPTINFFFFRADGTRNHSGSIVATILFQLFNLFPALKARVAAIASQNPVIFRQSMRAQFSALIEEPLRSIIPSSENTPLVILIDGLDECSSEDGKDDQVLLLNILHDMATRSSSPGFIVLVASRTEAHLTKAFNNIGCHPDSIHLDESYRPYHDIRVFITHAFLEIKRTHSLRDSLPEDWPPSSDINTIVAKSSGQFVYPATVARFVADSPASPKRSLEIVLGVRPPTRTSPFATLDSLYMFILSRAEDWSSVRDILAAQNIFTKINSASGLTNSELPLRLPEFISPLGYTEDAILSILSDLTAIVKFRAGDPQLTIHHASFNDFLFDKARAGDFYVDVNTFACRLAELYFRRSPDLPNLACSFGILRVVPEPDEQLISFLQLFQPDPSPGFVFGDDLCIIQYGCMEFFDNMYLRNPALNQCMRTKWYEWFMIVGSLPGNSPSEDAREWLRVMQTLSGQPSPGQSTPPLQHELSEPSTAGNVARTSSPVQDVMTERVQDSDSVREAEMQDQGTKVLWWFLILFVTYVHAGFVSK